jgi:hypothetical protein
MPIHYWVAFRPSQENSLKIEQPRFPSLTVAFGLFRKPNPVSCVQESLDVSVSIPSNIPQRSAIVSQAESPVPRFLHDLHEMTLDQQDGKWLN